MAVTGAEPISAENLRVVIEALKSDSAVTQGSASGSKSGSKDMELRLAPSLSGSEDCFTVSGNVLKCVRAGVYSMTVTATVTILGQASTVTEVSTTATASFSVAGASHDVVSVNATTDEGRYPNKSETQTITIPAQLDVGDMIAFGAVYSCTNSTGAAYCSFSASMSYSIRKLL